MPISVSPGNYPYKAYISNCLTYSSLVKAAQLASQGWSSDLSAHMGPTENNSGFIERGNYFRIGFDQRNDFKPEGAVYFGRLMHDLGKHI